ncbi:MAG: hypothetical protein RL172_1993 [Bacteroidota bacterium]|jgi:undecaprenol kinase
MFKKQINDGFVYQKYKPLPQGSSLEKTASTTASSFANAANGIRYCIQSQKNCRVHLLATVLVVLLGLLCNISAVQWLFVIGCCGAVLSLELLNTAIEQLCNIYSMAWHPTIKIIKDVAAGAVLLSVVASVITGSIIFMPKFFQLIKTFL